MRIGFEISVLSRRRTGVGHYVARLLGELLNRDDGHEYVLFSNRSLDRGDPAVDGAVVAQTGPAVGRWVWMQTALPRALRRKALDVCCFTNSVAPLRQHAPSVVVIHDASIFLLPDCHPLRRRLAQSVLIPAAARRAGAVVTVSETARADVVRALGLDPEIVHVVQGAPPAGFAPVTDTARLEGVRRRYALPSRFVLAVGTLEPRKNLVRLVRAHQQARRSGLTAELVLVGPRGWRVRTLERAASNADGLHRLGYVPTDDLPALYSLATAVAYPSLYEGFGLPLVEAMACGAPVIAPERPWAREVCGDAAGFVEPTDVDALAQELLELDGDAQLRTQLQARGLEQARRFSWTRSAARMVAVLEQAARG